MNAQIPPKNGRKGLFVLLLAALLVLLGIFAIPLLGGGSKALLPGDEAPDFTLTAFDGSSHTLSSYRGSVVVINFWASWCDPCAEEAALLEELSQQYRDQDVVFLGIAFSDTKKESLAYLETHSITYPNGPDLGTKISPGYGVSGVPETFIINPDGTLSALQIGPFSSAQQLETMITQAQQAGETR